jgi:hypothetical protein
MKKKDIIAISRHQAINADSDPEDTLMIQLTRQETWLVIYGLWMTSVEPELHDDSYDLLEKIGEVLDVQKNLWRTPEDGTQTA